jgi:hypothetical protein
MLVLYFLSGERKELPKATATAIVGDRLVCLGKDGKTEDRQVMDVRENAAAGSGGILAAIRTPGGARASQGKDTSARSSMSGG